VDLVARALQLMIVTGAVLVTALWWQDTAGVHGLGDWLTNAGRITGLLAGYAIVVLLLLMARVPVIETHVGADRLARWHAFGGRYTVSLVVAHTLLIIWGYAVTAHTNVIAETSTLLTSYPDVLMATVAAGLLVMVGAVSARAARRRLSYESWYFLHFYTYLAAALAFSHQFSTGADFVDNRNARVLWAAMYIGVALALVWYRFVVPARLTVRHGLRVADIRNEAPGVVSLLLAGDDLDDLQIEPGQFFRWRFLTRDGWWQSHPYSLSAPPLHNRVRITIKSLGDHSDQLQHVRIGTRVLAEGPYGAFTARRRRRARVVMLAGGVGITPLRALFETVPARPGHLTLIYRANTEQDILFRAELDAIAQARGSRVVYLIGDPLGPSDPFVANRLRELIPDLRRYDAFVCGPPGFAVAARRALRAGGVPARHIHDEQFAF
jgi:predicted ferric reductase